MPPSPASLTAEHSFLEYGRDMLLPFACLLIRKCSKKYWESKQETQREGEGRKENRSRTTEKRTTETKEACCYDTICCPSSPPLNASSALTSDTYWRPSRNGIRCCRSLSVGSLIQPCIGIALSALVCQHCRSLCHRVMPMIAIVTNCLRPPVRGWTDLDGTYSLGDCCPGSSPC